ncbi:MAG: DNA-directed RNA polymerase subunit alpha C-terminal domain-containing protein [Ginsengibacter sp.]
MQKEKWLSSLIFDNELFDVKILSEKEILTLCEYVQDKINPDKIALETGLPPERTKKAIEKGIEKILLTSKELKAKKIWFQEGLVEKESLQKELAMLKDRFKTELADEKLNLDYKREKTKISWLIFSVRASNALRSINVNTINDLLNLTLEDLMVVRNIGTKTVNEIRAKALEFGIEITWAKKRNYSLQ